MSEQAHLVFRLEGHIFAFEIQHVLKVHDLETGAEVLDWSEEVDLARFFELGSQGKVARPFRVDMLVGNQPWCFRADAVEDIQNFGLALTLPLPPLLRQADNQTLKGFFFDGQRFIHQLDAAELMVSRRFRAMRLLYDAGKS